MKEIRKRLGVCEQSGSVSHSVVGFLEVADTVMFSHSSMVEQQQGTK